MLPAGPQTAGSGQLAYIGLDGNVYRYDPAADSHTPVTIDANVPLEGFGRSYHRLAWSLDGWLAFAAVERTQNSTRSQIFVQTDPQAEPFPVAADPQAFVIYLAWSPVPCPGSPDCRRLAYLINEGPDIGLRVLEIDGSRVDERRVLAGRPVYFAWSPDGQCLWIHSGGERPQDSSNRLWRYDLASNRLESLDVQPGSFQAPAWSDAAQDWLVVSRDEGQSRLRGVSAPQAFAVPVGPQETVFALAPDGSRAALAERDPRVPAYTPVQTAGLVDGSRPTPATPRSFQVLAFFWAPGGERLAYLSRLALPDREEAQWRVADLSSGGERGYAAFNPAPAMRFMLNSFSQYAPTHRVWSPDGRYLVYSARDRTLQDGIWLVDTRAETSDPVFIAAGSLAVWSWR